MQDMSDFDLDLAIRKIKDFPKPGILFYDITSIFSDIKAFEFCIDRMYDFYRDAKIDGVLGLEARGFLFAAPLANRLKLPLVLVRKKGKLPGETYSCTYELEYGKASIEVQKSDIVKDFKYLVIDDLVATGGTLKATENLLKQGGANVYEFCVVIGLSEFPYEKKLEPYKIKTLIQY